MRVSPSEGFKILIAADPDPSSWPLHLSLVQALGELGFHSLFVASKGRLSEQQRTDCARVPTLSLIEPGLDTEPIRGDPTALSRAAVNLVQLSMDYQVDLVQIDQPALVAEAAFPCPLVTFHTGCAATRWDAVRGGPVPDALAWRAEQIEAGLKRSDSVICPTLAHAQRVQHRFGLSDTPFVVNSGRAPLAIRGSAQHDYVLTAGRLWDEGSNLRMLDTAARRIGVPVRAAGPVQGPQGDEVLFDNLHCLGNLSEEETVRWLAARPVYVSTALYDPLGLSILAAASAGCALILSDIPDYRECWDEVAIFVDPDDEAGFSETIANLVGDDFERAVIGRAARERAALRSPQVMAAQVAAIYRRLLPAVNRPVLAARAAA